MLLLKETTVKTIYSVATVLALCSTTAHAGEIDYQEFEDLFGEPVVTSVTGTPQRASELPASAIVVTGDDIRRSGATNLAEALRGYAGIDVSRPATGQYNLSIRGQVGVTNANTLVLINGRQAYIETLGYASWTNLGIQPDEIRQIEIVKGPNSAIFGFNAAAGVINIVTYNPVYDNVSRASVQVGLDERFNASGVVTVPLGQNGGVRFSAGHDQQERFDSLSSPSDNATERTNVGVDAGYDLNGKAFVRAGYNYSDSQQVIDGGITVTEAETKTESLFGSISAEVAGGSLSVSAQFSDVTQGIDFTSDGLLDATYVNDLEIYTAQFQRKLSSSTTLRVNADYRDSAFVTFEQQAAGGVAAVGNADYSSWGTSLMLEQNLSNNLTATGAIRFDSLDVNRELLGDSLSDQLIVALLGINSLSSEIDELSYNLSLVYQASETVSLRAQAARGTKLPSQLQFGAQQELLVPGSPLFIAYGNPELPASLVDSYELGANINLPAIGASATVSMFYTEYDQVSDFTQTDPVVFGGQLIVPLFYQEVGDYNSYGFEASLDARDGEGFDWRLDYTFNDIDETFTDNRVADADFGELTPKHKARAELGYNFGSFNLNVIGIFRSKVDYDGAGVILERDAAVSFDARAGYRVDDQIELFAVAENLTDTKSFGNGAIEEDTRARIGVRFTR